jgi:hypothetical protein
MDPIESLRRLYALIWLFGYMAGVSAGDGNREPDRPASADPDFTGKVLAIYFKSSPGTGCVLEKVQLRRLGSRSFLVGQIADNGSEKDPAVGFTFWVSVEEVTTMSEFKDLESARKFYRAARTARTSAKPEQLGEDVSVIETRSFALPLMIRPDLKDRIDNVRLYVSQDSGKSWVHHANAGTKETSIRYDAPRDGLHWFAVQVVFKDGKTDPADEKGLLPSQKVYVNSERKPIKVGETKELPAAPVKPAEARESAR